MQNCWSNSGGLGCFGHNACHVILIQQPHQLHIDKIWEACKSNSVDNLGLGLKLGFKMVMV
jgi:hypothetical protein